MKRRYTKRQLEQLKILVPDDMVEYFRNKSEEVKRMIEKTRFDKNYIHLEQWQYIAYRIGLTDKEKVIFT